MTAGSEPQGRLRETWELTWLWAVAAALLLGWAVTPIGWPAVIASLALVVVTSVVTRPQYAVFALVIGLLAGSRAFAYIYLPLGPVPLFVTEGTLGLVAGLLLLKVLLTGNRRLSPWQCAPAAVVLLLVGVAASMRDFGLLTTGRNSVLVFYSLFFFFPVMYLRRISQVEFLVKLFLVITVAKVVMTLLAVTGSAFFQLLPTDADVIGLTGHADVMWTSMCIILILALMPRLSTRETVLAWPSLLVSLWWVVQVETRSAWTGLAVALPLFGLLLVRHRALSTVHVRAAVVLGALALLALLGIGIYSPHYLQGKAAELASLTNSLSWEGGDRRTGNIRVRWLMWEDIWIELSQSAWSLLFGVGFGKPFVHRFSSIFTSPTQGPLAGGSIFSPHNSQWFLVYRIGFVGFMVYAWLVVSVVKNGLRAMRRADRSGKVLMAALLSCFAYAFSHSLTDVVLESPHRGVIYWSLLGLCQSTALLLLRRQTGAGETWDA